MTGITGSGRYGQRTIVDLDATPRVSINHYIMAADSQLTGDGMGVATETAHTALTLLSGDLNETGRRVEFLGSLFADSDNGADTWILRFRLGGLTGRLFATELAWNFTAGDFVTFEGWIKVRILGASGAFDAYLSVRNETTGITTEYFHEAVAGQLDTLVTNDLVVTSESSSDNAAQQGTLRLFNAKVWDG